MSKRLNLKSAKTGGSNPTLAKSFSVNNFVKPQVSHNMVNIQAEIHRTLATPERAYRDLSASNEDEKAYPVGASFERPDTAD